MVIIKTNMRNFINAEVGFTCSEIKDIKEGLEASLKTLEKELCINPDNINVCTKEYRLNLLIKEFSSLLTLIDTGKFTNFSLKQDN